MKYCYQCGKMTAGDPLYCATCGRTYDVKLCPRQHVNPRGVAVCSKCGSRDLSTPQPKVPVGLRLLALLFRLGVGLALFAATLALVVALFRSPQVRQFAFALILLLAVLWGLWSKLPEWLQELLRALMLRRTHGDE